MRGPRRSVGDTVVGGGGRLEPHPVTVNGLEIGHLGADSSAAVSMDGDDSPEVSAILAEATEVKGVKDLYVETQPPENALLHELHQHVLFFLPGGVVFHGMPGLKEGNGLVICLDEVESGVDEDVFVAGVEVVGADLEVGCLACAQPWKWVP